MNGLSKERKNQSCHILSQKYLKKKILRKFTFAIAKFNFQNKPKAIFLGNFLRQNALWETNPPKSVLLLLQIPNPETNTEILESNIVGD